MSSFPSPIQSKPVSESQTANLILGIPVEIPTFPLSKIEAETSAAPFQRARYPLDVVATLGSVSEYAELGDVHVANPLASDVRIFPTPGEPHAIRICPFTSRVADGLSVQIPTFPSCAIKKRQTPLVSMRIVFVVPVASSDSIPTERAFGSVQSLLRSQK